MSMEIATPVSEPDLRDEDLADLGFSLQDYRKLFYTMYLQREFETRIYKLFRQGKLTGAAYAGTGHEAIAAGSAYALAPQDVLVPLHRTIGAHFLRGHTPRQMMCQYFGRANGPTRGRDGNMHCGNRGLNIFGMISHLGANIPTAAGVALASKIRKSGAVALTYIGEGASSIGDFHEGLNFAAVRKLPMVLVIDNNQYAYSTPARLEYACEHLVDRATGYGIPGVLVDGTDVLEVYRACREAVQRARTGKGPTLIEARTMRLVGHAVHDDASYVPQKLMEEGWKKDPVARCEREWIERGIYTPEEVEAVKAEIVRVIDDAVAFAEKSPLPKPEEAMDGVYAE